MKRLGLLLFFLILFVPTTYQLPKLILLAALLAAVAASALRQGRLSIDRTLTVITLVLAIAGLGYLALGQANGAVPGAMILVRVYVIWPLLFTLLAAGVDVAFLERAQRVLVAATLAIGAYTVLFVLHTAGWLPPGLYVTIDAGQAIGFYSGYVEVGTNSTAALLFLVPYFIATLLVMPGAVTDPVPRRWAWVALIAGMMLVLLSGRRGLLAAVALAPLVTLGLRALLGRAAPWMRRVSWPRVLAAVVVVVLLLGVYLNRVYGFDPRAVADMFLRGFEFATGEESAAVRGEQYFALLDGWAESPLVGWGYGTTAPGSLRSVETPWAYELSYLALLFRTGLLGVLLYGGAVAWLYWNAIRALRSAEPAWRPLLPILVGTTCFLVGNVTNPYLEKFDYLWVLFLPLMYINRWRLTGRSTRAREA